MKRIICLVISVCVLMTLNVSALGTSAKAAIVIDGFTGEVIYEQNADEKLPMASTTKIMTALLLCEEGDLSREITVSAEMLRVEGSSMGLLPGDRVTLHDLLYGMLLASGNDAANVTAFTLGGTVDGFVKMMNQKARQLGLNSTNFETPSGLDGEEHYTTARDLALLAKAALENREFAKAAASWKASLCYGNPPYKRSLTNHNKLLLRYDGAIGVKTGYTKKSGRCLVSAAERQGKRVIAVTLNDPDDWADHTALLDYGFEKIRLTEITPIEKEIRIPVINGENDFLVVKTEPISVTSSDVGSFSYDINLPKFLYAPVNRGEKIGSINFKKDEKIIKTVDLCSNEQINEVIYKASFFEIIIENIKNIFKNIWEN